MIIYARAKYHSIEGETWSFKKRYVVNSKGLIFNLRGRPVNYKEIQNTTTLKDDNNKNRSVRINRLILSSFVEEKPPPGYHADHKDEERWDDKSLSNLQWLSPGDNTMKKRAPIRDRHSGIPVLSITTDGVIQEYPSLLKASKITGISDRSIGHVCLNNLQRNKYKAGGLFWSYDMAKIDQENMDNENWKDILKRYGAIYETPTNIEVSNKGRMRWIKPIIRIFDAFTLNTERDHITKTRPEIKINKERRKLHEIVCTTFNGPPPFEGAVVRHLNDDIMDCRACNLKWGTRVENAADAKNNGKTNAVKIIVDDIYFSSITEAAKYLNVSVGYLCDKTKKENRTSFSKDEFLQRSYLFQGKNYSTRKEISCEFELSIGKVRTLEKQGKIIVSFCKMSRMWESLEAII